MQLKLSWTPLNRGESYGCIGGAAPPVIKKGDFVRQYLWLFAQILESFIYIALAAAKVFYSLWQINRSKGFILNLPRKAFITQLSHYGMIPPAEIHELPTLDRFKKQLKTHLNS